MSNQKQVEMPTLEPREPCRDYWLLRDPTNGRWLAMAIDGSLKRDGMAVSYRSRAELRAAIRATYEAP